MGGCLPVGERSRVCPDGGIMLVCVCVCMCGYEVRVHLCNAYPTGASCVLGI